MVPDNTYSIIFALYDVATGGTALWTETQSVVVINGIFNVILGSVVPLNLPFEKPYWLGVTVASNPELTPRFQLTSSPYSFNARSVADSAITGSKIEGGQVVRSINALTDHVNLVAGNGTTVTSTGSTITIATSEGIPAGVVVPYAGSTVPDGWLLCDGAAVSRTTYAALFLTIGTSYGPGDGSTTFNLPNLAGKIPVGRDSGDSVFDTIGETGGEKTHTLTIDEMPSHNHRIEAYTGTGSGGFIEAGQSFQAGRITFNTGGSQPHNNLQPYIVLHYIIKK